MEDRDAGIVLAAYGSLEPRALSTYERVLNRYVETFPGISLRLAFTSGPVRKKLGERRGIMIPDPFAALCDLRDAGVERAVVQSLHMVPGREFHKLASLVACLQEGEESLSFRHIALGMPLLSSSHDCRIVSAMLGPFLARIRGKDGKGSAVVLMGHGTDHPADSSYSQMALVLRRDHKDVFLSTLGGFPRTDELASDLKAAGVERVVLVPFLLVAGGHALRDMAGEDPHSCKSLLSGAGFEVKAHTCGMAECEGIVALFLDHTRKALDLPQDRMEPGKRSPSRKMDFE